ncbi:FKBP-type peptidyl-prolyl cis-trans isomerase [Coxiella burnetii]|uniref:Peptidyl-prolyl cis-trans isomerase n=2 Tax=Coxiella burnetii TaxID=777 RepID=A9KC50_COXBN|nr:FKBP-type peptidyl-prolyl cis-trans isomerase [Coxiella burnetii]ABS77236.1 FKBP-type peptidyl-prolyl cis-trans isomerase [Coxiella burnetii Dugway 5J108-111]ACJ18679.1 FKBP-type peptidyl-prolyl cis-trans isomerase [Coxiella burnetii CbuG_Q212]ATN67058.1 hypothetical protein AYM17_06725 [Coxiella burnetii]ATN86360.1 hypothetical protein AYO29_07920 [Coxiella burnetii str. Schperling]OYK80628.1 hypothetical protein CbuD7E6568_03265 [Coxiella burnetii]
MKRLILPFLSVGLLLGTTAHAATPLKTEQDKLSYSMGVMTGKAFRKHDIKIDPQTFSMGLSDAYLGKETQMTEAEMRQTLQQFQKQSLQKMQHKMKQTAQQNAEKSRAFLTANKNKPGVKTLANGLQYKVLQAGQGQSPTLNDEVTVNYEGRLINGTVFDSSYKRGQPATFPLKSVIKGWQEALTRMKPGAIWEIYVPPQLAYGEQGAPGVIGPNEALIFKVNLISVKKK